ncbi:MAG: hypothetical protein RL538_532 [Candidatus Parcubacteria bacterium]|jgi:prepilin-type N-terminal cleavage/methylation domain-containing protein
MKLFQQKQSGFTLVEMIVALAVFAVVITISVGALLMLVASNDQLRKEQAIMTNLSFALDSMTREIRTGTHYYCASENSASGIFSPTYDLDTLGIWRSDCPNGKTGNYHGLAFKEGGNSISDTKERIMYYTASDGQIYRKVGRESESITASTGVYIKNMYFNVVGSVPLRRSSGQPDEDQASVTIYIEASESATSPETYYLQTTVSQRVLDL